MMIKHPREDETNSQWQVVTTLSHSGLDAVTATYMEIDNGTLVFYDVNKQFLLAYSASTWAGVTI